MTGDGPMTIELRGVRKVFGDGTVALAGIDLAFERGEFLVLLGPSGCGKSTMCRILAGLEVPTAGAVAVDGVDITAKPPRERDMSMVFQNYALYPHKTVYENIAYPLRVRGRARTGRGARADRAQIDRAVREMAEMLAITELLGRRPRQLSGGEAQRVAVARALVWQPAICLMDEPLSNLDALLRLQTRAELKRIHRELQTTFVFVTHDQEEAMSLGTRIAVLDRGRMVQIGTPHEVYHRPRTRFVAEFIGRPAMNTIAGEIAGGVFRADELAVRVGPVAGSGDGEPRGDGEPGDGEPRGDGPVVLGIRPEDIGVAAAAAGGSGDDTGDDTGDGAPDPAESAIEMTVDVIEAVEPDALLVLVRGEVSLTARVLRRSPDLEPGVRVHVWLPRNALHFFDAEDGHRL